VTYLANHDALTGLPNRTLFYDRLGQSLARAHREGESIAVLFIDLDGFKLINDTLGHDSGDILLREVADRIMSCVRESDTVARMGGDEFTVILMNIRPPLSSEYVARKIIDALTLPFMLNGKESCITASVGIAIYPDNGDSASALVKLADAAMYLAKNSGKNCYHLIDN
jgi:diguanylate cyclase (GGDEF)-like protein